MAAGNVVPLVNVPISHPAAAEPSSGAPAAAASAAAAGTVAAAAADAAAAAANAAVDPSCQRTSRSHCHHWQCFESQASICRRKCQQRQHAAASSSGKRVTAASVAVCGQKQPLTIAAAPQH